jgi:hypothetical protein
MSLVGKFSAAAIAGLADGATVATWVDSTGTSDLTQAGGGNRPIYKTGILNGLPVVRFDGTDFMDSAVRAAGGYATIVMLVKVTGAGTRVLAWNGNNTLGSSGPIISGGNRGVYLRGLAIPTDGAVGAGWERWVIVSTNAKDRIFINGIKVLDTTTGKPSVPGGYFRLGGSDGVPSPEFTSGGMDVAEVRLFDTALTDEEAEDADAELYADWYDTSPPTGLVQSAATPDSVTVDWDAPTTGVTPTAYHYRVDGGSVTSIPTIDTFQTIGGLAGDTDYLVEVRSSSAAGDSDWVSVVASTTTGPQPPVDLVQANAGTTYVVVEWDAPADGPAATGYELRVDGGAPTDVGDVFDHLVDGLAAGTDYLVEVRTLTADGPSAWASVLASTEAVIPPPMGGYLAHLRVGTHEWDISSADDPAYGPLAGLRHAWQARQDDGWPTQHDPTVTVFGVIVEAGTDFDDVDQGTDVHFVFTPDGYTTPLVNYGGTVRDLVGYPHERGMVYEITAVDHLQKLREDYTTVLNLPAESLPADVWPTLIGDAGGVGGGIGTSPFLPDPFTGDTYPGDFAGGSTGPWEIDSAGSAWDVMNGYLAVNTEKPGAVPAAQRATLTYRLDAAGDLDDVQPFEATWSPLPTDDTPRVVPGRFLVTGATGWSRPRIEPNVVEVVDSDLGLVATVERPHVGVDVVRSMRQERGNYLTDLTNPYWVAAGTENVDQWSTQLLLQARQHTDGDDDVLDATLVADWFTLPAAMSVYVQCQGIDNRHTPTGTDEIAGLLAGAALVIPPGGDWRIAFQLRRALPGPLGTGV